MKRLLQLFLVLLPFPAHAADPTIVDACKRAAEHYWNAPVSAVTDVQAFPELSPPRVRMKVATEKGSEGNKIAELLRQQLNEPTRPYDRGEIRCEFTQAKPPFGLSLFCPSRWCSDVSPSRMEELQVLMKRDGL